MAAIRQLALCLMIVVGLAGAAQAQGIPLLRDAEAEYGLDVLARPILTSAGLPARRTRVLIVNDMAMNAFVIDSRTVFVNAGLILRLQSADQLQAVIAHEVGHIANGHTSRRALNAKAARNASLAGIAAGVAAGVATGNPGAGAGIAMGTTSSAMRVYLSHSREEEAAADSSGLVYMAQAGIDPKAFQNVLGLFEGQEAIDPTRADPYVRSHPLTRDRLRAVGLMVDEISPQTSDLSDRSEADYWFARVKGKLSAYMRSPGYTFGRLKEGDTSDAAQIARAMAYFRSSDMPAARREIGVLIERSPNDAYAHELLGWMEIESGNPKAAIPSYEAAARLAPNEPLIKAGYGRALLAVDTPEMNRRALEVLEQARSGDSDDLALLRDLAIAYSRAGDTGKASLATAERYALAGKFKDAEIHAERAAAQLPVGSPGWERAQDVIREAESKTRR